MCKDEETNEEAAETMRQGLPKLWDVAPEIARTVERPFQFEEFEEAAKRCGRRRTPGEDGIPSEVWLRLWKVIGMPLFQFDQSSMEHRKNTKSIGPEEL